MAMEENVREIPEMEAGNIIREAMKERYMMQVDLADKMGILQSSVSGNINRKRMSLGVFEAMLDALDYDVAVVDRYNGEVKWKVNGK